MSAQDQKQDEFDPSEPESLAVELFRLHDQEHNSGFADDNIHDLFEDEFRQLDPDEVKIELIPDLYTLMSTRPNYWPEVMVWPPKWLVDQAKTHVDQEELARQVRDYVRRMRNNERDLLIYFHNMKRDKADTLKMFLRNTDRDFIDPSERVFMASMIEQPEMVLQWKHTDASLKNQANKWLYGFDTDYMIVHNSKEKNRISGKANALTASNITAEGADMFVAEVVARGWHSLVLTGGIEFQKQIRLAMSRLPPEQQIPIQDSGASLMKRLGMVLSGKNRPVPADRMKKFTKGTGPKAGFTPEDPTDVHFWEKGPTGIKSQTLHLGHEPEKSEEPEDAEFAESNEAHADEQESNLDERPDDMDGGFGPEPGEDDDWPPKPHPFK